MHWGAGPVGGRRLGIGANQPGQLVRLERGGLVAEGLQIGDAEPAGAGGKGLLRGECAQGRETTRAFAADHQPPPIHLPRLDQRTGRVQAVGDIQDAPLAGQALAVATAVAGRAGIVDLHHGEPTAGEELGPQVKAGLGVGGRPRMGLHQQRRPAICWAP
jgi:hypothetical protein